MMAGTATETKSLAAFTLPGSPYSTRMARFYIRAALTYHSLGATPRPPKRWRPS
jgi:hypothetical protein